MIIHYGYKDGSGEYYISIDAEKCDTCGNCVKQCPQGILKIVPVMVDLEDKPVAAVAGEYQKKIKYTCASCQGEKEVPCAVACENGAISFIWIKK